MTRGRALGPGRLRRRRGAWELDYAEVDGRRVRRVIGRDRKTAEQVRAELIRRRDMQLDGLGALAGQEMRVGEVVDLYLQDLGARVTAHHLKNVALSLARSMDAIGRARVRDLRPADVVQLRAQSLARGASNRTANLVVTRIQAALRWAVENGVIAANPLARLKGLPTTADHQRYAWCIRGETVPATVTRIEVVGRSYLPDGGGRA
jgi:hypothetical protein